MSFENGTCGNGFLSGNTWFGLIEGFNQPSMQLEVTSKNYNPLITELDLSIHILFQWEILEFLNHTTSIYLKITHFFTKSKRSYEPHFQNLKRMIKIKLVMQNASSNQPSIIVGGSWITDLKPQIWTDFRLCHAEVSHATIIISLISNYLSEIVFMINTIFY